MKILLYILALIVMAVGAFYSFANIEPHQEELTHTTDLEKKVAKRKQDIVAKVAEIRDMKAEKDEQQQIKNKTEGKIEVSERDKKNFQKQSAGFDGKLNQLVEKKEEVDRVINEVKAIFEKEDIPIGEVAGYVEDMEGEKKTLNQSHVSLLGEKDRFESEVKVKKTEMASLLKAASDRRENLKANGVSSLVTAVDNDWGFVVVKPHEKSLIKQGSQLIVIRGSKHVGRLTINAIEKDRVLANIDYKSMVSGMRIRPGDRVILGKVVTR